MSSTSAPKPTRLRSPFARAVVPVLGGIAFFVVLALVTWGIAAYISRGGAEITERLAPTRFVVDSAQHAAGLVEEDGPIILAGLNTTTGEKTLVLDHEGDDPTRGGSSTTPFRRDETSTAPSNRSSVPASSSTATAPRSTSANSHLPMPASNPVVEDQRTLVIDLRSVTTD